MRDHLVSDGWLRVCVISNNALLLYCAVEASHVDGNLVDNVAESGEESEDEWNYYKGEGEREQNPSEEADEPPRSETPCQDNVSY